MADALTTTLTITGLSELDAVLRALPQDVAGPIMKDALEGAGEVIRVTAAANIHRRSGKTAADIRVQVQVHPEENSGVAAIGGTKGGEDARGYILRFLEFGARGKRSGGRGWNMQGGAEDARTVRKTVKALRKIGETALAAAVRGGVSRGEITTRRALGVYPGGIPGIGFRARAHHPGYAGQSPLTRALASSASASIEVFKQRLWRGIQAVSEATLERAGIG